MTLKEQADATVAKLREIEAAARSARAAVATVGASQAPGHGGPAKLDPHAVAAALADALKNDGAVTQAIAVRVTNLATKYPNKAY